MEAEDLVEPRDHFAAPPAGGVNELLNVGQEAEMEEQVSSSVAWQQQKQPLKQIE